MAVNFATIDKLIEEGFLMDSRFNSPAEIASLVSKSGEIGRASCRERV